MLAYNITTYRNFPCSQQRLKAAVILQRAWRYYCRRSIAHVAYIHRQHQRMRDQAVVCIQRYARGWLARRRYLQVWRVRFG